MWGQTRVSYCVKQQSGAQNQFHCLHVFNSGFKRSYEIKPLSQNTIQVINCCCYVVLQFYQKVHNKRANKQKL